MQKLAVFTLILMFSLPTWAQKKAVIVKINGLVCDFCVRNIENVFRQQKSVKDAEVDLERGTVTLHLKSNTSISNKHINTVVTQGGYKVESIERILTP